MLMSFSQFAELLDGELVTIVGCGKTTVEYRDAITTKCVVLVNYALNLAPLFPEQRLYHVSLHAELFHDHPLLQLPNVTPIVGQWGKDALPAAVANKAIFFGTRQFADLDSPELRETARDRELCVREGVLCHAANSSHCAIHVTWLLGCRDLRIVGATEYRGLATPGYDERLGIVVNEGTAMTPAHWYISSFRQFVALLDWRSVCTLGY